MVLCCKIPDVAVTVIFEVVVTGIDDEVPPPHPLIRLKPSAHMVSRQITWAGHRFFRPRQKSPTARTVKGNTVRLLSCMAAAARVVTVTVVFAMPVDGVTVAGEKLHVAPDGSPEQVKEVAALNPPDGVT